MFASRALFAVERADAPLTDADLTLVDGMADDLDHLKRDEPALRISRVVTPREPFIGKRLLSEDGHSALLQISLATPFMAVQTANAVDRAEQVVRKRLAEAGPDAPKLYVTGHAGVGRDLIRASAHGLDATTVATVILVVVILLLVYRAPLLALVPLVTIAMSVWVALKILSLCTLIPGFYLVNTSQIFAVVMLYGAGTDYCLFLISRYREFLAAGRQPADALTQSVASVGGALAASAGTVICGLGLMAFAEFAKMRSGGPAIAIGLAVALAASLTLAPALLRIMGSAVFWPVGLPKPLTPNPSPPRGEEGNPSSPLSPRGRGVGGEGFRREPPWGWLSRQVTAHPVAIWVTSVLVLLPLAVLGFQVHSAYRATGELAPTCQSVQGLAAVERHFNAGEAGPVTLLLESPTDWDTKDGRAVIRHLCEGMLNLDNIAEVRSLTQPLGEPVDDRPPLPTHHDDNGGLIQSFIGALSNTVTDAIHGQFANGAREVYLARPATAAGEAPRYVTRLDVVLKTDPFDPKSNETLDLIEMWLKQDLPRSARDVKVTRAETYGVTVGARDLANVTEGDRLRIDGMVLAVVFLILLVLVRRPWLAGYLLATVLFSYYATLGATTLFAWGWHGRPLGEVDWRVPFFLFIILIAVGEDYNILLITRTLQEKKKYGAGEGTRRALSHTGGAITSCGLIMAGTFATLMLAGLNTLVQIGFALAFGVLLDTFVVRPFLVPAFTLWVWRRQEAAPPAPAARLTKIPSRLRRAG